MPKPKHKFERINIDVTEAQIEEFAERYISLRSHIREYQNLENNPIFKDSGFSTEGIRKIIESYTVPIRHSTLPYRDIYRSDFGELLLTLFFDEEFDSLGESFIIPIKNIWDREHNDMPGRGIDVTGYKTVDGKIEVLIGEAKVSEQKTSPPKVSEEIYQEQKKYASPNSEYLKRRLSNYSKKLPPEHSAHLTLVIFAIDTGGMDNIYEIVFGCCLVRDTECFKDTDYGKIKSNQNEFNSHRVHFIIPVFDKPIKETVDLFYRKIQEKVNG